MVGQVSEKLVSKADSLALNANYTAALLVYEKAIYLVRDVI